MTNLPNATGQSTVTVTAPTATDSCVGTIFGTTPSPLTYSTQGTFTIVWTYNDNNGNTATQNQTVIVADTIAPTTPTNLIASGTTSTTTNLSWTASSDNIAVTGYNVYIGATLLATVATTTYTATGLTPLTVYTFSVIARDAVGNLSAPSNSVYVTTLAATYCASGGNSVANEKIGKVVFGSINNTSTAGTGYENFTSITTNAMRGTTYTITITPTWTSVKRNEGYAVWIDYNGDGDFTDTGEQVWTKTASKTTPVSGTFTIPATATLGNTRMRVAMKFNAIPTSCETFPSGQVEDYTVTIVSSARIIDSAFLNSIKLYPNPIKGSELYISDLEEGLYRIFNSLGQEIAKGTIANGTIPISDITTGTYLVEIISNNQSIIKRFIKQ